MPNRKAQVACQVWLAEVQECRLTLTLCREVGAGYFAVNCSDFSDVIFGSLNLKSRLVALRPNAHIRLWLL